jgi:acetylxylan esterase
VHRERAVLLRDDRVLHAGRRVRLHRDLPVLVRARRLPFGCNLACTTIPTALTPAKWGAVVRNADPGYHGPRPRVQIWHGTADANVLYANFGQEISQWTDVLGVSQTPLATDHPEPGWTRTVYGRDENDIEVEAHSILDAGHDLPQVGMEAYVIRFFGLDQG